MDEQTGAQKEQLISASHTRVSNTPEFQTKVYLPLKTVYFAQGNFYAPKCVRGRRQWHPTPVLLLGKSHGWRSLVGYSPWGREESDTTNDFTFTFHFHALEKEMAIHSSVLAWRIPGTGEPGGLSLGSHRVGHN